MAPMPEGYTKDALTKHWDTLGETLDRLYTEITTMEQGLLARRKAWNEVRNQYEDVRLQLTGARLEEPYVDQP